jgi:hypothetical protein
LGYEKPVSTDAKAKILIGSFLPFSTASVIRVILTALAPSPFLPR